MPADRLLRAAVEGEMVDGEGDVWMRGHAAFFSSHLVTAWPDRIAHTVCSPGCCAPCGFKLTRLLYVHVIEPHSQVANTTAVQPATILLVPDTQPYVVILNIELIRGEQFQQNPMGTQTGA